MKRADLLKAAYGAVNSGDEVALRALITEHPQVLKFNEAHWRDTLLHVAAEQENLEILKLLVEAGMDPNVSSKDGLDFTPLHRAADRGQLRNAEWLLDHGARIEAGHGLIATPLGMAAQSGQIEMMKFLVARGADPRASYSAGTGLFPPKMNPMLLAASEGQHEAVKYLVSLGIPHPCQPRWGQLRTRHHPLTAHDQPLFFGAYAALEDLQLLDERNPEIILETLNTHLDRFLEFSTPLPLGERTSRAYGALWGSTVCELLSWEWVRLRLRFRLRTSLVITDPQNQYVMAPLDKFSALLDRRDEESAHPQAILENIREGKIPVSCPQAYTLLH